MPHLLQVNPVCGSRSESSESALLCPRSVCGLVAEVRLPVALEERTGTTLAPFPADCAICRTSALTGERGSDCEWENIAKSPARRLPLSATLKIKDLHVACRRPIGEFCPARRQPVDSVGLASGKFSLVAGNFPGTPAIRLILKEEGDTHVF